MKDIITIIKENKTDNNDNKFLNLFDSDEQSILGSIIKRTIKWDKNKNTWSRYPMFLTYDNGKFSWLQPKFIKAKNSANNDVNIYNGYLTEYINKNNASNIYILGIYINRSFYPIFNENEFNQIYEYVKEAYND